MKRILLSFVVLAFATATQSANWIAGTHYTVIQPQRTTVPAGKVEVMEVFSYGCPACNQFRTVMRKLKTTLPPNAQLVYLPASWHPEENWPLFQRAYLTALSLGIAEKTHDGMFDAIWNTRELGITDASGRIKKPLPSINDVAAHYQRVAGVKAADFITASKSFGVDLKMRQADSQITAMQVGSTPTLIVAGKYRVNNETVKTGDEIIELIKFLVAKESGAAPGPASAAAAARKP